MTANLVWLKSKRQKCELQVWRFDPSKALKKRIDIVRQITITDYEADILPLKALEDIYGSVYQSDTVE